MPPPWKSIGPFHYQIPATYRQDMRVPACFFSHPDLIEALTDDRSIDQLINTATLPGIAKQAMAMPDMHQGYGFPIGGVVATRLTDGVISPGGVGYDINCGVRLLGTHLNRMDLLPHLDDLAAAIQYQCPSGVGQKGHIRLNAAELEEVLETGGNWALKRGFATAADLEHTEEAGCLSGADASVISERAKERGKDQIGTLGAGNHFIEVDAVETVFDTLAAERMGLYPDAIVVQIHCGSRGLGHQVCSDYVKRFQKTVSRYGYRLPDRELVYAPLASREGTDYLAAMNGAANFAFANRQVIAHRIRRSFEAVLAGKVRNHHLFQIYDIAHNMAKIETHEVDGHPTSLCVHRKGATRAFGPGSPEIPAAYRDIGQPVMVPGSMGTASWVLTGTPSAMELSFGSCCHGAGRQLSRRMAKKRIKGMRLKENLEAAGIRVRAGCLSSLAEEAPLAYKDVDRVVDAVHGAGIANKVARVVPLAVIKG
ncbi:MAG: RtcB family protein [Desulfobacterales bacterium]